MKSRSLLRYASVCLFCLIFAETGSAQQQDTFPLTLQRVLPAIVKVIAETNAEMAGEMMAEVVSDSVNKLYSTGTGFFISPDGLIMTADHVIAIKTGSIFILQQVGNEFNQLPVTVVWRDTIADIAVLRARLINCPYLHLLDPVSLPVGTNLAFIGFPLDFYFPVVSRSVLSAKVDEPVKQGYPTRHQLVINQFVNHGNSGGPLFLASTGQVVGVVSWRPSPSYRNRIIVLPKGYHPVMTLGGVDPIRLSVDTYNENLKYIGDIAQFGIGFVPSVEYAKQYIK